MSRVERPLVVADIGGTNARFALATIGQEIAIGAPVIFPTDDIASFGDAWHAFERHIGARLPRSLAVSFAGPVDRDLLQLTNSGWRFTRDGLLQELGLEALVIVNDFGALGHAVPRLPPASLRQQFGPSGGLPSRGAISIIGPGTGLGVAALVRDGRDLVLETEGGHIGFAPTNEAESRLGDALRRRFGRVSVERLVSGPGLANIHLALGGGDIDERELWRRALAGEGGTFAEALDLFLAIFGSVAGDLALAHGAEAVVLGGGVGARLVDHLTASRFHQRFCDKGRFADRMAGLAVFSLVHPQPGLFGAAAAFAAASSG
jgi:glucokinase